MDKRLLLVGLVVSLGCGGTPAPATPDAYVVPQDTGVPPSDTGPVDAFIAPQPALTAGGMPADYSCLGTATAPTPGAAVAGNLQILEYLDSGMTPIANQPIEIWTNNMVGTTCAAPNCTMATTSASGDASVTAAADSWFAYRLPATGSTAQIVAYNRDWPSAAGDVDITAFSSTTVSVVSSLLGRMASATAGSASGTVRDCMDRGVMNGSVRLYLDGTDVIGGTRMETTLPRITGLEGTSPTASGLTGSGGTFVGANAPLGHYRVEIYGSLTAGGDVVLVGCEEGMLVGGGITVFSVGPLRIDYAAGSECEAAAAL